MRKYWLMLIALLVLCGCVPSNVKIGENGMKMIRDDFKGNSDYFSKNAEFNLEVQHPAKRPLQGLKIRDTFSVDC
jgi:hypothetical protein